MSLTTLLLFFIYCFGLGFTATSFVKNSKNFLERNLMRVGFGLALLPFLGLILNLFRVPIDWKIILVISLIYPAYFIFKNFSKFDISRLTKVKITKTDVSLFFMLLIFLGTFYIYGTGAFKYPYLEDDDPWGHAIGVKYMSMEKTAYGEHIRYMDPYHPTYDMLLGILHQTNDSVYWTLKFFNALIISLCVVFFYFFMKEFSGSRNKALFAAFALASIPCFLSHFIWAIALTMPLFFVSFYAVERIKYDKKWWILAGLVMVTTLTSSPTHSAYFGLFFSLYLMTKIILEKKILFYHISAGVLGLLLSFVLWWLAAILKYGVKGVLNGLGLGGQPVFSVAGTADRIYTLGDFVWAKTVNMINNPVGIGLVLSLLLIVALFSFAYKNYRTLKKYWLAVAIIFLVFNSLLLVVFSNNYIKHVPKRNVEVLEPGSVPFFEFVSDQSFLIVTLLIMVFVTALLFVVSYNYPEFKEKRYIIITLVWLIFTFYAVNAGPFNLKLSPFRAWMLLAIPVCILAAEGAFFLIEFLSKAGISKIIVLLLIITGVLFTSTYQKYTVNTAQWPPGGFWTSMEELQGYLWLKDNLPPNTKVFSFVHSSVIIGMDKFICHWCEDITSFQKEGVNESASDTHSFLKSKNYEYLVIEGKFAQKYGINETNEKLNGLLSSGLFKSAYNTVGFILLQVV